MTVKNREKFESCQGQEFKEYSYKCLVQMPIQIGFVLKTHQMMSTLQILGVK